MENLNNLLNLDAVFVKEGLLAEELNFQVVSTRHPKLSEFSVLNSSYSVWKKIWQTTFNCELGIQKDLSSDDFLFNNEIGVLYFKNEIIGLIFFNWLELGLSAHTDHSYFSNYPKDTIDQLKNNGVLSPMFMSNLTILPSWRKSKTLLPISEVLIGLAIKRFLASYSDELVSFTRNSRKVNDTVYKFGARPLKQKHQATFDNNVDVISINKKEIKILNNINLTKCIDALWRKYEFQPNIQSTYEEPYRSDSVLSLG